MREGKTYKGSEVEKAMTQTNNNQSDNVFKPEFLVCEEKYYGILYFTLVALLLTLLGFYVYSFLPEGYVYHRNLALLAGIIGFFISVVTIFMFLFVDELKISLILLGDNNLIVKFSTSSKLLPSEEKELKINEIIIFHSIWKLIWMSLILSFNFSIKYSKQQAPSLWFFALIIFVPIQILAIHIPGFVYGIILFLVSKAKFKSLKICWLLFLNEENAPLFYFICFTPIHTCNKLKSLFNVKEV